MAKVTIKPPTEFEERLSKLGNQTDAIIEKVLEAGADVVVDKVRSNLQGAIGSNTKFPSRSTGELVSALGVSPVKVNNRKGGHDIKVGFREPRSGEGHSNAKVANILEHGRSSQPARPFLKPAASSSRKPAIAEMERTFEEEVSKL